MNWDDFRQAFDDAKNTQRQADDIAGSMARMVVGRLRSANVAGEYLTALKKELRDWDIHRGTWKDRT